IFKDLELPPPKYNLEVGSGIHGEQTGKILERIEKVFLEERPTHVIVQGDTNTTLAGALAARKLNIRVGHIEAGLRSFDHRMPEETNRTLVDHMSDFCFAPTPQAEKNLIKEGLPPSKIHVTGNTVVDAVIQHLSLAEEKSRVLETQSLTPENYFLITAHRAETIDNPDKLRELISAFQSIAQKYSLPVIFPIHPRTEKNLQAANIELPADLRAIPPIGYLDMLKLIKHAALVITDSGGLQEEACILETKCVTIRDNTERPETVEIGGNIIAGTDPEKILTSVEEMLKKQVTWKNPFGDGTAGNKCIDILTDHAMKSKKVCVVGLGYMGLPTASLLATHG
ncbi:MAG: non-hydrolyzing UDP-N-acetylglucosamine 2-epimerase, partial [Candidatus Zixiibacteriota bacterium]